MEGQKTAVNSENERFSTKIAKQHLIYFSPTGSSRKTAEQIASAVGLPVASRLDLTFQSAPSRLFSADELVIFGIPVYAGRIPELFLKRIQSVRGSNTPAVITVLYGNRDFEDALLELKDTVSAMGFLPIAAAAFIGEHSFSTPLQPIAAGRPDQADLEQISGFGKGVAARIAAGVMCVPEVPGNKPYKERPPNGGFAPETDQAGCTLCSSCARVCPASVITVTDRVETEVSCCILCCACLRVCPARVRTLNHPMVTARREMLIQQHGERKSGTVFL